MIGHDDDYVQLVVKSMTVATRRQHNITRQRRQNPPEFRHERNEMRSEIFLQMGQIAPVELHTQILS